MKSLCVLLGMISLLSWAGATVPSAVASDVPSPLSKLSTLIGREVQNLQGEELGEIEEVVMDAASGDTAYAVLAFGGFLGLGEKRVAVPWRALRPSAHGEAFMLDVTEEQLKNAPSFDPDQWPNMEEKHWGDTIHAYFGQAPYWGQRLPAKTTRETAEPAEDRLLRSNQVLHRDVMNLRDQHVGNIEEVVVDTASGDIAYAVLSFGGFLGLGEKWFAIPWAALQPSAGLGTFELDVTEEALEQASGFDKDQWPDMANRRWATAVHTQFGQPPYWERRLPVQTMPKAGAEVKSDTPADAGRPEAQQTDQPPAESTAKKTADVKTSASTSSETKVQGQAPTESSSTSETKPATPTPVKPSETSGEQTASFIPVTVENAIGTVLALRGPIVISCQPKQAGAGDAAIVDPKNRPTPDANPDLVVKQVDGTVEISCGQPTPTEKKSQTRN